MERRDRSLATLSRLAAGTNLSQIIGELVGVDAKHPLAMKLVERRITPDVIQAFNIRARGEGWAYPTPRGALRFKNANSGVSNKYAWLGDKRDTLLYRFDLREAIQLAGGEVWLVTEFDLFAMRSAGICHVLAPLQGEGSVPVELSGFLQSMAVHRCHIAPDRDDQGRAWARLVVDKIASAGIEVDVRELPYPHEKKHGGDVGRLWQEYSHTQPLEQYLLNLPITKLPTKIEIKEKKVNKNYIIREDLKAQIARALGVKSYDSKGYSENLHCPFHEDAQPSAGLHREYGLHCFTEGKWYKWRDLANVLGIKWESVMSTPIAREVALGDELIKAMVKAGFSVLAHVLETLYRAGWKPGQTFTLKSLTAEGVPNKRAIKAFAQMDGREADARRNNKRSSLAVSKRNINAFCPKLAPFFFNSKEEAIPGKKVAHRLAKVRVLPNPADLAKAFGVTVTRYTHIPLKQNLADWRAELYALQIDHEPGTYPRKELCAPLGISRATGRSYDKRASLTVTPNFQRVEIKSGTELPDTPELKAVWLESEEVITDKDGVQKFRQFIATKAGYSRAAESASQHGGTVWMVKRLANDYRRGANLKAVSRGREKTQLNGMK